MTRLLRLAAIPLAFAVAGILMHLALHDASPAVAREVQQPLPVANQWYALGALLWVLAFAAMLASGAAIVRVPREPRDIVLVAVATLATIALAIPVAFSSDVYAYAAYGDALVRGVSPYAPVALPATALGDVVAAHWPNPLAPCVYGPLFVALAALALAPHPSPALAIAELRLLADAGFVVAILAFGALVPDRLALAAFALNPVALWAVGAEGHNDAIMLALALLGLVAAQRSRPLLAGVLLGAASLVKVVALVALAGPRLTTVTRAIGAVLVLVALGVLLIALAATDRGAHATATNPVAIVLRLWQPWYALWVLPLAAWRIRTRWGGALYAATILGFLRYLPDATVLPP